MKSVACIGSFVVAITLVGCDSSRFTSELFGLSRSAPSGLSLHIEASSSSDVPFSSLSLVQTIFTATLRNTSPNPVAVSKWTQGAITVLDVEQGNDDVSPIITPTQLLEDPETLAASLLTVVAPGDAVTLSVAGVRTLTAQPGQALTESRYLPIGTGSYRVRFAYQYPYAPPSGIPVDTSKVVSNTVVLHVE